MTESKTKFSQPLRVFVYGTLKPGEANYQKYCAGKVINAKRAVTLGKLFALPMGYPAMTLGQNQVQGYLLSFSQSEVLSTLDYLEDYQPLRPIAENLYNRQQVEIYDLQGKSLGWAWAYLMSLERIDKFNATLLVDGWWSGCGLTAKEGYEF
ncbi:gamma-glutamylcyclotransferase [Nostoc sp. FACHB-110]|uniref:gamma-glutamylcyclotransferase family protein n=1 Tax=Nostoc sp. FACHB-110 TaxID=2692834 RepID=UPI001683865C|nr:gamma-glutamylcyclotransferase [Nostoc sp. FACHB-110]MBD2441278.1 gamma-glutamylcyclotransferase [Nostoc sp. FACHB-110]